MPDPPPTRSPHLQNKQQPQKYRIGDICTLVGRRTFSQHFRYLNLAIWDGYQIDQNQKEGIYILNSEATLHVLVYYMNIYKEIIKKLN